MFVLNNTKRKISFGVKGGAKAVKGSVENPDWTASFFPNNPKGSERWVMREKRSQRESLGTAMIEQHFSDNQTKRKTHGRQGTWQTKRENWKTNGWNRYSIQTPMAKQVSALREQKENQGRNRDKNETRIIMLEHDPYIEARRSRKSGRQGRPSWRQVYRAQTQSLWNILLLCKN